MTRPSLWMPSPRRGWGGHFFGTAQTMAQYETAFHAPMLSNWDNFPTWQAAAQRGGAAAGEPDLEGPFGQL